METLRERLLRVTGPGDMRMIKNLPLVVVIERESKRQIYRIDDIKGYRSKYRNIEKYFGIKIKEAEELCNEYGIPIPEEEFSKLKVFPWNIRHTLDGSYIEYSAKFESERE